MTEPDQDYRRRQEEQFARFLGWKSKQGTLELPVSFDTLLSERQQARMEWLKVNRIGRTLEIGCNAGFLLAWVGGHVGVDLNPMNIELAKLMAPKREFYAVDARDMKTLFDDLVFDTVMLPEVLEHLDFRTELPLVIEEAVRVCRKRVLITVPDGRPGHEGEDATCFKHRWLADERAIRSIVEQLRRMGAKTKVHFQDGFVMFRSILTV